MPFTTVRDIEICYELAGSGPGLLAISGTRGDLRKKPNFIHSPLVERFTVLAFDQRGLGRTSKPDAPYSMADYADDAAGLLDAVGWSEAAVIGYSFGGMVAQELVLRHPRKVSRLVLAATSPGGAGGASFPFHTLAHLSEEERAQKMVELTDTRCDAAWATAHPAELAELLRIQRDDPFADEPGHATGAERQLEARRHHDTWDRLPQIRCPVLVACGRFDGIALPETQSRLAARIPGARLLMFDGGHTFLYQDPRAYPAISDFLVG